MSQPYQQPPADFSTAPIVRLSSYRGWQVVHIPTLPEPAQATSRPRLTSTLRLVSNGADGGIKRIWVGA